MLNNTSKSSVFGMCLLALAVGQFASIAFTQEQPKPPVIPRQVHQSESLAE